MFEKFLSIFSARLGIILVIIIVSIFVFALIYYGAMSESFHVAQRDNAEKISFADALAVSTSAQTLLGSGDIVPTRDASRLVMMLQAFLTLTLLLTLTTSATPK
jgi:flagellar basal body-associated protein FliL